MDLLQKVEKTIEKFNMLSIGDHVLVGLSGGPDSVCLLHVLRELKIKYKLKISASYIDHGLRPNETPKEIEFCQKICNDLDLPFYTKSVDVREFAKQEKINLQESARILRYGALDQISLNIKADKIAVAHNADDQAETVIMRLLRGSGPAGLSGIPPVRKKIIRPLIEIERVEIEEYLNKRNIQYIKDPSNESLKYLRNKIRHTLMPVIKSISPQATKIISKTADIMREENDYINVAVTKSLMRLMSRKTDQKVELFCNPMEILNIVILRRALRVAIDSVKDLRGIEFDHIEKIIDLIKKGKPGDRIYLPKGIKAIKNYSTLVISAEPPKKLSTYEISKPGEIFLQEASIVLSIEELDREEVKDFGDGKNTVYIDREKINFPLILRPRKPGDFFYPFGFGKKKKLQDFFVDEKIPRDERDLIPIIENSGEIVFIAGYRLDDRYKIEHNTKRCLKIKVIPKLL
ncbi:MAG: tRNA lysidine(34) synthetase TilS [Thermodesulfovibrio sp.]|uniref:tRNA lysidine(34) synthetase TilS n=1 Tax=unclassified Thermodesulfovibrio TaxID=2645936 RepID=UPI00083A63A8|nr:MULTISPECIES: tRNA lysidine(34) synthetase TilS [unclassified Thermodesulfovibrio]MDI1472408.1 tRNA lysidine(34) synthetase TilS [Thermodesulfovibrio sp. 1176]MDI6714273.1 tRNA lysidine(34) synthetase TilS [Thermodesulfovibrio sp.]ODA44637.1 tRNA(Ile)-lysidine synthetase [Thermodesulfovibrio sp. N1]